MDAGRTGRATACMCKGVCGRGVWSAAANTQLHTLQRPQDPPSIYVALLSLLQSHENMFSGGGEAVTSVTSKENQRVGCTKHLHWMYKAFSYEHSARKPVS
eukprot:352068-Chlamydomonas_euryale.AAC.11